MESAEHNNGLGNVSVQFINSKGEKFGDIYQMPSQSNKNTLSNIINNILEKDAKDRCFYSFFITNNVQDEQNEYSSGSSIVTTIENAILSSDQLKSMYEIGDNCNTNGNAMIESVLRIVYTPEAVFRVRPITRCTSTIPGHKKVVLCGEFSPDGRHFATGSADFTVRFWDLNTQSPEACMENEHKSNVMRVSWSPDGRTLASCSLGGEIILWAKKNGKWAKKCPTIMKKNSVGMYVSCLAWKPLNLDGSCRYLAAGSRDKTVTIWDTITRLPVRCLSGFQLIVTCVKWTGENLIIAGSQDTTVRIWKAEDGVFLQEIRSHSNWVTSIGLSTDFVIRTGAFDPISGSMKSIEGLTVEELQQRAQVLYDVARNNGPERMAVSSDDQTVSLWRIEDSMCKAICKPLVGHQNVVTDARFSPNGLLLATPSFDKSVRIWDGMTGAFLARLLGHANLVYFVAWSVDSRMLVSAGKDSSIKLWSMSEIRGLTKPIEMTAQERKKITAKNCKRVRVNHLIEVLPGHAGEVNALDWSPDGTVVGSGSRDTMVKLWRA